MYIIKIGRIATVIGGVSYGYTTSHKKFYTITIKNMKANKWNNVNRVCKVCWKQLDSHNQKIYCSKECYSKDKRPEDLTWKHFWKLTVLCRSDKKWKKFYKCECCCWNIIDKDTYYLTKYKDKCMCKNCLYNSKKTARWLNWTRFWNIFYHIKRRCNDVNNKYYWWKWIKCEWGNFIDFYNDMYESYKEHCEKYWEKDTSIDRKDNNKNYCKENCRWATYKIQSNNRKCSIRIEYNWGTYSIEEMQKILGISKDAMYSRYYRSLKNNEIDGTR